MAARAQVQVEGLARLRRTLKAAGDDLTELKDAHRGAASIAAVAAQVMAPRRTGTLAASVKPRALATSAAIVAGTRVSVPYAPPIHWGWPSRNIEANPWVSAAAQRTEPIWLPLYEREIQSVLNQVKGV